MGLTGAAPRMPRPAWIVAGVFLTALLLRLEYIRELFDSGLWTYLRLDPLYYHDWAIRISKGDVLGDQTYEMTPLYAYALGVLFKLFGYSLLLPRLLQAILGACTSAIIAWLGGRIFGRAEGLAGGLVVAAYGPALFHDTQIMKTVLTVALSTATAALLYQSEGRRARWLLAAGSLLGLTALCQENINVTLPFLLAWIAWRGRDATWKTRAARGIALLAGFAILVSPATIRNYLVSGEVVLITSGGGEVFYTGNNELASGKYQPPAFVRPDPFFEHEDFRAEAARRLGRPVTRSESDAFWWKEGFRFVVSHPGQYLRLLADKLTTYFNAYERPDNYSFDNFRKFIPLLNLPLPRFGWVAPLGILGLVLSARRWPELLPLQVIIGCYVLSGLLFFTQDRYRMPMVPLLSLFAAHALAALVRAAQRREMMTLAWVVPSLVALTLLINRNPGNSAAFEAQHHGILGEMYLYAGRPAEAAPEFRKVLSRMGEAVDAIGALQDRRMIAAAHYGLALTRADEADDEAVAHLRAAGESPDPETRHDALERLGGLLMRRGDPAGAAQAYEGAVAAGPPGSARFELSLKLAEALHKSGRAAESLRTVEETLRGVPPDLNPLLLADAHYGAALIQLRDLPDSARAAQHLREVLRLNPDHPRAAWIRETLTSLGEARP